MRVSTGLKGVEAEPSPPLEELRFQRCTWCSTVTFRARLLCPVCSSTDLRWERGPAAGKVCGVMQLGRKGHGPRTVMVVELGSGVRVRCEVEDAPIGLIAYGARVTAVEAAPNGVPVFRLDPVRDERW
ncbi:Zn-ribbon domain-containing OB-fold protein [Streptomyces luteolus]|uniref:Zinc ribbon domain-containing protein n=1 Tax=Streptomyces luteolus TaxID=3043615 RepID=A0ABT6T6Y9_9ACTN|nr:zinc ribbon domain-containing protein [Streptomyces sp. B-S-A12]MDI3423584.1 zinc ribbon domain-containing protein [Streptomyces sp. B-S-A12]